MWRRRARVKAVCQGGDAGYVSDAGRDAQGPALRADVPAPDRAARRRSRRSTNAAASPRPICRRSDCRSPVRISPASQRGSRRCATRPTATSSIPAAGFGLAGTLTTPPRQGRLRHPAVVLVAGSGPSIATSAVAGIPLFAQLAGAARRTRISSSCATTSGASARAADESSASRCRTTPTTQSRS